MAGSWNMAAACGMCGNKYPSFSANAASMPTITVTGACSTLTTLAGARHATSLALASALLTKMNRAGIELTDVGPSFSKS